MKKRILITLLLLLVALPLIAIVLRSRGYLYPQPNIKSVSPNTQYAARLFQLKRMLDKNYRITIRDTKTNRLIVEYTTPDEGALNGSVRFIWNAEATGVLLAGNSFSFDKDIEPSTCIPDAYLLIDLSVSPPRLYSSASQRSAETHALNDDMLKVHEFCTNQ